MSIDKTIERIQKLRRLAESTNVNEAAVAGAEAQRLMTENRISEASLSAEKGTEEDTVTDLDILAMTGMKTPQSWLVTLASLIGSANGCKLTIQSASRRWKTNGEINLYGRPSDVNAAKYLIFAMKHEIERLADDWTTANPGLGRGATISFKHGAASEIGARMVLQASEQKKTVTVAADSGSASASGALLVINRSTVAVDMAVNAACGGSNRSWGGSGPSNYSAFSDGKAAGRSVNVGGNRGLGAAAKKIGASK